MHPRTYGYLSILTAALAYGCSDKVDDSLSSKLGDQPVEAAGGAAGAAGNVGAGGRGFVGAGGDGIGEVCVGEAQSAEPLPVDMYIMLDQSSSMAELLPDSNGDKWTGVVQALQAFVNNPAAAGIGVGIQYFGLADECNPAAYAQPEVDIGILPGTAQAIVDSTLQHGPTTLTPTYPALKGALDYMVPIAQANAGNRAAIVVLATDGFPTRCQADGTPTGGASIQDLEDLARQYAELDPPVRTYVIGVGEALANLNSIAEGGGTGQAFLIESGDVQTEFLNKMLSIASTPLQCEFDIPTETEDPTKVVDKDLVQVIYTPATTREAEEIPKLNQRGDCAINRGEGWFYDHPDLPTKIYICPETCKRFAAGSVAINVGCAPTGVPM